MLVFGGSAVVAVYVGSTAAKVYLGAIEVWTPPPGPATFVTRDLVTGNLMLGGQRFRFSGANVAQDIGLVDPANGNAYGGTVHSGSYLTPHAQIDAVLDSAEAMNAPVIRPYSAVHTTNHVDAIQPTLGTFNATGIEPLDYAVEQCAARGIRMILPLVNEYTSKPWYVAQTGGGANSNFHTRTGTIDAFKAHITYVLNHVNIYTGIALKDDPTILCWETGNELTSSGASSAAFAAWTDTISQHIKLTLGAQQLVMDGGFGVTGDSGDWTTFATARLALTYVDIYSTHCYDNFRTPTNIELEASAAHAADKAFVIGEYTWTDRSVPGATLSWDLGDFITQMETSSNLDGDLYWDLLAPGTIWYDGFSVHRPADGTCRIPNPNFPFTPYFMPTAEENSRGTQLVDHALAMVSAGLNQPFQFADEPTGATISVITHGATINNSANDDRPAFTAAIAAANAGDIVWIPNGNYHFKGSQAIACKAGVTVRGESQAGVIINTMYTGQAHSVFYVSAGDDNTIFENFSIRRSSGSNFLAGIRFTDANDSATVPSVERAIIRNVTIENHQRFGIQLENTKHVLIDDCTIKNAVALDGGGSGYGILHSGPACNNNWVRGCTIGPVIRHTLLYQRAHHNLAEECDILGAVSDSITFHGHDEYSNEIRYNTIYDNVLNGTSITPNGAAVKVGEPNSVDHQDAGEYNWIHHNEMYNCPKGVHIANQSNFTYVEDNHIHDCDDGVVVNRGYHTTAYPDMGTVQPELRRNTIEDNGNGIRMADTVTDAIVNGNIIRNNTGYGIYGSVNTTGYLITGNTVTGNGTNVQLDNLDGTYIPG